MLTPLSIMWTLGCTGLLADTGEPGDPCEAGQRKAVAIGQGELAFEGIAAESDTIELIYGPQGGQHVVIAARAWYLDAADFVAAELMGHVGGQEVAKTWPYIDFRCNTAEGALDGVGMLLVFTVEPEELHEQVMTVELSVTDLAGDVVRDERTMTIYDPYQAR